MQLFAFKNYNVLSKLDSHVQIDFVPKKLGVLKCHKSLLFKTNNFLYQNQIPTWAMAQKMLNVLSHVVT
jgi:hypothetical protein